MAKVDAICTEIKDSDTFRTNMQVWVRLTRVNAPELGTTAGIQAKRTLESLILNRFITYESVAIDAYGRTLAEVWVGSTNVNDYMRAQGYGY